MRYAGYLRPVVSITSLGLLLGTLTVQGCGQTRPQPEAAAAPQLRPYTAPDQSASAGLPPGWKVTRAEGSAIEMTGPNRETIFLGQTVVARNAPFQPGQRPAGGIDISIPNSANLAQKFTMIVQGNAAISGRPAPQVNVASATPISVPAMIGQCGRLTGTFDDRDGQTAFGLLICSLPVDVGGTYKIIMKLAKAPPDVAAREKELAAAVFASYRVPPQVLRLKFAPHFAPAPNSGGSGGGPGFSMPDDTWVTCFDYGVLREYPDWKMPKKCGGPGHRDD